MTADSSERPSRPLRDLTAKHGRSLLAIASVSVVGIIATAGFQIVASRGLGPEQFGVVAALLAFVNIASVGSSALRNAVAVGVASGVSAETNRRSDPSMIEAFLLGGVSAGVLVVTAPWTLPGIGLPLTAFLLTVSAMIPYFLFARAQGILQGARRSTGVVLWSTGAQVLQLGLTVVVVVIGAGATGVLAAVLATALVGTIGASVHARRVADAPRGRAFTRDSVVVLALTIVFAWLTNADVILVRAWGEGADSGMYAAAAVLVKTTLILPTTLSLYLLPRFVTSRDDPAKTRRGVHIMLVITLAGGVAIAAAVALFGPLIVAIIFGAAYSETAAILPLLAVSWIPWALGQAMLVRVVAMASARALVIVSVAAIAQAVLAWWTLPDIGAFITANGILGLVAFAGLYVAQLVRPRPGVAS